MIAGCSSTMHLHRGVINTRQPHSTDRAAAAAHSSLGMQHRQRHRWTVGVVTARSTPDRQVEAAAPAPAPADGADSRTARLFSNLNPKTLRHEPGSLWGSVLLVSGTTIGAGILALPAVTQEAGFVPAAATLTAVCGFSIITGLLVAETSIRLMQQQGGGSVSMITMAKTTLGPGAAAATSAAYIFLHYALLVAYISKAGEIVSDSAGLPLVPAAAAFTLTFALLCYCSSQQLLDKLNGGLVGLVVACFVGLLVAAAPGVDAHSLVQGGHWSAIPATLPVVALAFVYHNVVPVVVTALEADTGKVRTAICAGVAIPWLMFVSWEAAILGSLGSLQDTPAATQGPANGGQELQVELLEQIASATSSSSSSRQQSSAVAGQAAPNLRSDAVSSSSSDQKADSSRVSDPLAALSAGNATVGPLIQGFSFLAIATSYIGFILGLTDFLVDALKLPNRQAPLPYVLTLLPPFAVAVTNPNIFLSALDTAGTYGVLTLFGILPAAMAWQLRYGSGQQQNNSSNTAGLEVVGGGPVMLLAVAAAASSVVAYELLGLLMPEID